MLETTEERDSQKKGVHLSPTAIILWVIATMLVVVAVGLIVGLVARPPCTDCDCTISDNETPRPPQTTSPAEQSTTTEQSTTEQSTTLGPWSNIRLPKALLPLHYVVELQPYLTPDESGLYWFSGKSEATFNAAESTEMIIIHSNQLKFSRVEVFSLEGISMDISNAWLHEENQYLVVELNKNLLSGQDYVLKTEFTGELSDGLTGFYRSTYFDAADRPITIASTQMWPTEARKTFPCFDEPALKATYDVIVWHQDPFFALSNMPANITETHLDWKKTTFQRSVKMSSYLFAVVVSQFGYIESFTQSQPKIKTRIYARPSQVNIGNVNYAKNITPVVLDYYAEYFGVKYPLPKSDQVAIPDFKFGAMENWGLVTYRETALLYDSSENSASNKQRVAAVISHELAHQWFGNLITPLWWDEFWLNEGFASFVEYLGQEKVEPTWRVMDQFILIDMHTAMTVDGLATSRPIVAENVTTNDEIQALVDDISYSKGACVIRMISHFTGEEAFKLGLKNYLEEHAYGSVEHTQLFEFWEAAAAATDNSNIPPGGFVSSMNTWVLQMGYPIISVKRHLTNPNLMVVQQERFLLDPNGDVTQPESPFGYKWVVPFWYKREADNEKTLAWLTADEDFIFEVPANDYVIGNYEVYGYYRVNYDLENWKRIIDKLNSNFTLVSNQHPFGHLTGDHFTRPFTCKIPEKIFCDAKKEINVKSRGQTIDDAFNLARSGKLDYSVALDTTTFLREDFDYIPWQSALNVLEYFDQILGRSKVYGLFSAYLLYLVEPLYSHLTWTDDGGHLEQLQRINAIDIACTYGDSSCITRSIDEFERWQKDPSNNPISPNLRETVYCQAVENGGSNYWELLWNNYQTESDSQEKLKLQNGLTCVREPWIVQRFLDLSLNDAFVRKQDAPDIWISLCDNEAARDLTWDFLRNQWDLLYQFYGESSTFGKIINGCTARFSTEFELRELELLKEIEADKLGSGARAIDQAIEKTQANIDWRQNYEDSLFEWFSNAVVWT